MNGKHLALLELAGERLLVGILVRILFVRIFLVGILVVGILLGSEVGVDGELAKLQVYKTEADVFGTIVTAQAKRVDSQIQRNQQILEEFKAKMQQELQLTQIDESIAKYSLNAYEAMARVYIAETNQELEQACNSIRSPRNENSED